MIQRHDDVVHDITVHLGCVVLVHNYGCSILIHIHICTQIFICVYTATHVCV